jgi:hypothetical protein
MLLVTAFPSAVGGLFKHSLLPDRLTIGLYGDCLSGASSDAGSVWNPSVCPRLWP